MTEAPAGWFTNPDDSSEWRYWDGSSWTDHTAPRALHTGGSGHGAGRITELAAGGARVRIVGTIATVLIVAVGMCVSGVAAWYVLGRINYGFCVTESWQSAAATEAESLVPVGARQIYTTKHDCDDRGYVSVEFEEADTTEALNAVYRLAPARGWVVAMGQSSAGAPCFEKVVDGTPSVMLVGAMAPSSAWVEVHRGTCSNIYG